VGFLLPTLPTAVADVRLDGPTGVEVAGLTHMTGQLVQALHVLVAVEALVGPRLHKGGAAFRNILHTLLLDEEDGAGRLRARLHCLVPGLEKNPVYLKRTSPVVFFWFFRVLWVFLFFWVFILYICPEERVFRVFPVSRILLGASRLCS
jgi:hypothetical protein